ncbi:MAG: formate/nitrite transporter family protein [Desulfoplanes sp.]|nr:formate/nitrite transporter family protein [Desulfoplanes sp.]
MAAKSPAQIASAFINVSDAKANLSIPNMIVLGIFAGAYIGFGAELCTIVLTQTTSHLGLGVAKLLGGSVFSLGLMLVVIGGAELFTGNNLMAVGVCSGKIRFAQLLNNWFWVYFANFAGSLLMVFIMYQSGLWHTGCNACGTVALDIAAGKCNLTWGEAFFRAIGCNWLVCLAVWLAAASDEIGGKIWGIFFPIMGFVASGFEHCVANMYFVPPGIFLKSHPALAEAVKALGDKADALTWSGFIFNNLIPVTLGNIVGGALFVGCAYYFVYLRGKQEA